MKLGLKILSKIIRQKGNYGLLGDIEEIYQYRKESEGWLKAKVWYYHQIYDSLLEYLVDQIYWGMAMFLNYFKVAVRSMKNQKVNSFINIFSLSIGIAFSILVMLFVKNEYSYDNFHKDSESIYRVGKITHHPQRGKLVHLNTPNPLRDVLTDELPQVEYAARISSSSEVLIKLNDKVFIEDVESVDPEFFSVFSFPITNGVSIDPLADFSSVVISEDAAAKFFGSIDPIGKIMSVQIADTLYDFKVSAVFNPMSNESSLELNILISYMWIKKELPYDWAWNFNANIPETFVKLNKDTNLEQFEKNLQGVSRHFTESLGDSANVVMFLNPLSEIHHIVEYDSMADVTDVKYIYILIGLGILVLTIACINFMTLSIGRSVKRAKEVGVRKVIGAHKKQLVNQYLSESILISAISLIAGVILSVTALPVFNNLAGKHLVLTPDPVFISGLVLLTIIIGIAAGAYPAFVMSGFLPTKVLKGSTKLGGRNIFGKLLVVIQFSFSIFLIAATLIIREQLDYMQEKDLGFDQGSVIELQLNSPLSADAALQKYEKYNNELVKNSSIMSVSAAFNQFGIDWTKISSKDDAGNMHSFYFNIVDYSYLQTLEIELLEGRDFSNDYGTDRSEALIVNESLVNYFGWENPLGKKIPGTFGNNHQIIGVVKDFNYKSLHTKIEPLVLAMSWTPMGNSSIGLRSENWPPLLGVAFAKLRAGSVKSVLESMEASWKEMTDGEPFTFKFIDENIQAQYEDELRIGQIIDYSSIFALLIAVLGLFGLSTITAENRIKEVGIRKVLGANSAGIVTLISKDLIILVSIANLIAWPTAFILMTNWLDNFAFRINIGIDVFIISGLFAVLTAFLTVSYNALKAANSNPVESLRCE